MERLVAGAFGIAFGGIGLAILGYMWLLPFGEFESPPLFFRIVASFIAIPFVATGGSALYAAIQGKSLMQMQLEKVKPFMQDVAQFQREVSQDMIAPRDQRTGSYACPRCAAPIGDAEISPSGDVKCRHCQNWYNVRGSADPILRDG